MDKVELLATPPATLVACLVLMLSACKGSGRDAEPKREDASEAKLIALANRYDAVVEWYKPFSRLRRPFTFEIEDALMPAHGRPVALRAYVQDIRRTETGFVIALTLSPVQRVLVTANVRLFLNADQSNVDTIRNNRLTGFDQFAVIARVTSVSWIPLELRAERDDYESESGRSIASAKLVIEETDTLIVEGDCVQMSAMRDK